MMRLLKIKRYLPYLLILIAFVIGQLTSPRPDRAVKKQFEDERRKYQQRILRAEKMISTLEINEKLVISKMKRDSITQANAIADKDRQIRYLKQRINEINLNNATVAQLDSIRARLYGTR